MLGGTSVINGNMYVRGNKQDYDDWAAQGNPGWSYEEIMPYFKNYEKTNIFLPDDDYHGYNGTLNVENVDLVTKYAMNYLTANLEVGRNFTDYNGKNQIGYSIIQMSTHNGRRVSSSKAFLKSVNNRNNLRIVTRALVLKLLMRGNIARGVRYLKDSRVYCAYSTKEVIVSAGTFNSPQLLMLSGIGPKDHLKEYCIDVIQDLPVGKNMWDHLMMILPPVSINVALNDYSISELIQQYLEGHGYLTTPDGPRIIIFENLFSPNGNKPDIEYLFTIAKNSRAAYKDAFAAYNYKKEIFDAVITPYENKTVWSNYVILLHPKSRGNVKLKSKSPFDFPLINLNYFSDPEETDIQTLMAGIRNVRKLVETPSMQALGSQIMDYDIPGCEEFYPQTDDYDRCLIQYLASTIYHYAGTCKMGPSSDNSSVVDNNLKVHGIKGLRVIDASVIPVTTSGHTMATVYMIAEKGADLIKKTWL